MDEPFHYSIRVMERATRDINAIFVWFADNLSVGLRRTVGARVTREYCRTFGVPKKMPSCYGTLQRRSAATALSSFGKPNDAPRFVFAPQ